jgi:transposase
MNRKDYSGKVISIGIDVHKKQYTISCVMDGIKLRQATIPPKGAEVVRYLRRHYAGARYRTAYEAGFSGFELHRYLERNEISSIVVNAASVEISRKDRVKTDRRDSLKLALQLDRNQLSGIRVPSVREEASRVLWRTRKQLVSCQTRYKNRIRMRLYQFGYVLEESITKKRVKALLSSHPELPEEVVIGIEVYLRMWEKIAEEIKFLDEQLATQADKDPHQRYYYSLPGIGKVTARILSTELGDMSQFSNERKLFSFLGLTPSERSSGEKLRRGGITHQGNPQIRSALIESAWSAIEDEYYKANYNRLKVRIGGNKAIVAIARKLIGTARALIKNKQLYRQPELKLAA